MDQDPDGLFGDARKRALQARALADHAWAWQTPGACFAARLAGVEDPERLGWDTVARLLTRDGCLTLRMIPVAARPGVDRRLAGTGHRVDWYDVFEAETSARAARPAPALPQGFAALPATGAAIARAQAFMAAQGVAPAPGAVMAGCYGPAVLELLADATGALVAAAFAHMPYNRHSPHAGTAWAGLVAVAPEHRGRGLGVMVNARCLARLGRELQATRVQEFAAPDNIASRRTIERSGLALRPDVIAGVVTPEEAERFTR